MNYIIMNEQHTLLPQQQALLGTLFPTFEIIAVPATGWSKAEMQHVAKQFDDYRDKVVFVSPIPFLMGHLLWMRACAFAAYGPYIGPSGIYIFHNDKRNKQELPDGRIIHTVATDGWELIEL